MVSRNGRIRKNNGLVAKATSSNTLKFIISKFHFYDNDNLDRNNKYSKIRPLYSHLNKKFISIVTFDEINTVNVRKISYFSRHGCKQYIHRKPIRFGYVNWMDKEFGVGAREALKYTNVLRKEGYTFRELANY